MIVAVAESISRSLTGNITDDAPLLVDGDADFPPARASVGLVLHGAEYKRSILLGARVEVLEGLQGLTPGQHDARTFRSFLVLSSFPHPPTTMARSATVSTPSHRILCDDICMPPQALAASAR